ncbi:hypothetical protein BDZ91DRAFT_166531 [Kalaharituber pfeilii]|nr:hypothetical protein BDZ91DRAFT_166531 [Kalaharituber pfeilii]
MQIISSLTSILYYFLYLGTASAQKQFNHCILLRHSQSKKSSAKGTGADCHPRYPIMPSSASLPYRHTCTGGEKQSTTVTSCNALLNWHVLDKSHGSH